MKYNKKIVTMDYRHSTAQTFGIFADPFWPRDDETILSNYHRLDKGIEHAKLQRDDCYDRRKEANEPETDRGFFGRLER